MRKVVSMIILQFQMIRRNPSTLTMMLVMPLIMIPVLGLTMGGMFNNNRTAPIPLAICDQDQTYYSRTVITLIRRESTYTVRLTNAAVLRTRIADNQIGGGIILPTGLGRALLTGEKSRIQVLTPDGSTMAPILEGLIQGIGYRLTTDAVTARMTYRELNRQGENSPSTAQLFRLTDRGWQPPPFAVETTTVLTRAIEKHTSSESGLSTTSVGFTLMFLSFTAFMSIATILIERKSGTWARLLSTPTAPWQILSAKLVYTVVLGTFQALILIGAGSLLFNVNWGTDIPAVLSIIVAYIVCLTGIGMFLSTTVKNYGQMSALSSLIINVTAMLGGLLWPREIGSEVIGRIGSFLPQAWAMDSLRTILFSGSGIADVLPSIILLVAVGGFFLAVGTRRVRFE